MSSWGAPGDEPTDAEPLCAGPAGPKIGTAPPWPPPWVWTPCGCWATMCPAVPDSGSPSPSWALSGQGLPMAAEQRVEGWATADVAEPEEHFFRGSPATA